MTSVTAASDKPASGGQFDNAYAMTIDGRNVVSTLTADSINPATGKRIARFPLATRAQLNDAVAAARHAFDGWRNRPVSERQAYVARLGDLIDEYSEQLKTLLTMEQGKPRAGAEWEVGGAIYWCREIAKQSLDPEVIRQSGDELVVSRYTPIGVVGAITPWNFPLLLAIWKIAPALVAGNTMVLKPSPFTPLCTLRFGQLTQGLLPPGVLNVVSGDNDCGQWMTEHPDIGKISFTGSTATGKKIMQSAAVSLKRLTLELGGNDPAIVLADVDPKAIAKDLFWAAFQNSAQFCVATKRLYVHEDVYDAMCSALVEYARTVRIGDGLDPASELGPLQNRMQYDKVRNLIADSKQSGHRFLLGGDVKEQDGFFIPVTLVDNPPENSRVVVEEAFGPVLPILKFRDVEDVIARANNTAYGLAASVWGNDIEKAQEIAERLEAGTVWINHVHVFAPDMAFGGHKQSGIGIENSLHGLAEYSNMQTIMRRSLKK